MLKICIAGVTGWTGKSIAEAVVAADDLALVCGVARSVAGRSLAATIGVGGDVPVHASVADALRASSVDVLIDYTSAAAVFGNVRAAVDAGVHVVVGSSGLTATDYAEIDGAARDRGVGVIAAGNFSLMAAVLARAAALAAQHLDQWEIIDYASAEKPDVPSGTARELAEALAQIRAPQAALSSAELLGPVEARGADVAGTRVHSVRLPSFVVSTEIVFGRPGERLTMRHDPGTSPAPYVAGTLFAARTAPTIVGLRRGLDSLLFDNQLANEER